MSGRTIAVATWLGLLTASAQGQGIVDLALDGDEVTAGISLPGGVSADLSLVFEGASGLTAANLGLTAQLINPTDYLSRLPSGTSVPTAFPVLLQIEPPGSGGLEFSGVYTFELYTALLDLETPGVLGGAPTVHPLRLFRAASGGVFADVTGEVADGSYRTRGTGGSFSEFLILLDTRSLASVIGLKLDAVDGLLTGHAGAIEAGVLADLESRIDDVRSAWEDDDAELAASRAADFAEAVHSASGSSIPDDWRAARDLVNVAGLLRAAADTLHFSLGLAAGS